MRIKKAWPLILGLLMLADSATQAQFTYTTNNGMITITGYTGLGGAVTIPSNINGLPVTDIGSNAFANIATITSATIPNSVKSIDYNAFDGCVNLTNATIPNSVTSIGIYAFVQCGLTSLTIPNSVVYIGDYSFEGCTRLTSVIIPTSVTNIGGAPFDDCSLVTAINVDANNPVYSSVGGVLFNKSQTTLLEYPAGIGGNYNVPPSVVTIYVGAFGDCTHLTSVTIPDSVTSIENAAFGNTGLTSVTIPNSVSSVVSWAFYDCAGLTSVYFRGNAPPDNDPSVFQGDNNLTVYYFPGTTGWSSTFDGRPAVELNMIIFSANPTNGVAPLTVSFASPGVDGASNTITNWNWSFGDGSTRAAQNLSHVYNNAGNFQPSLVAINNLGVTIVASGPAITVTIPAPIVAIQPTNNPVLVIAGSNVTFSVSVAGSGPFTYQWQFNGTNLPNGVITTVAGDGPNFPTRGSFSGDGGLATNASLNGPEGIAMDASGDLLIADTENERIRIVTNGIINTVAGNGAGYYSGDGGAASNAGFVPWGVAHDKEGNLFIVDGFNNRIRKVATNGIITTVAGDGPSGQVGGYSGDGGEATNADLNYPEGVVVDASGDLFIADSYNNRIRKVDTNGIISTVAGLGPSGATGSYSGDGGPATNAALDDPTSVAVDVSGDLLIADCYNNRIRKVGTNGIITTFAGSGPVGSLTGSFSGDRGFATNATFDEPIGVTVDPWGNLLIADLTNERIRKVDTNGIVTTVAGNGANGFSGDGGPATNASFAPWGVAVDNTGNVFIADPYNNRIRKVAIQGPTLELNDVGTGNAGAYDVVVSNPYGSVTSSVVNLTIAVPLQVTTVSLPIGTNAVAYDQALTASGGQQPYTWTNISGALPPGLTLATNGAISGTPTTNGIFNFTVKVTDALSAMATQALAMTVLGLPIVTIQPTNNPFVVAVGSNVTFAVSVAGTGPFSYQWQINGTNLPNGIINTVAGNGTYGYSGDGGTATNAELTYPSGVAVDATGNLFIADYYSFRIRRVGTNGIITTFAGNGTAGYSGDGAAATSAELGNANGMAVDGNGNLFIADTSNQRIRKVGTNGIISTVGGNGTQGYFGDGGIATNAELYNPYGVAVDATGNLFIADTSNQRIRRVGTNGIITTVAGNGTLGYFGDGGAATSAELWGPSGVSLDATGNLIVAELYNDRIRKLGTNGIITTVAGNGNFGYSGNGGSATNAEFYYPRSVSMDGTGNLFIADSYNNRIREVGTNGIVNTAAGGGGSYPGDGGAATNAQLNQPESVAVDTTDNLFIADSVNSRIRKVVNPSAFVLGPTLSLNDVTLGDAGAYDVVVSSPYGSVTSSVVNLTIVLPNSFQYTANPTNGMVPLTVQFSCPGIDGEGKAITNWNWNFADGSTSTAQNPSHTYTLSGTYAPTLFVTNNVGTGIAASGPQVTVTTINQGQYAFGPQIQSTPSASITYNSETGAFQYTGPADLTDDHAYLPLTGAAAALITTSNAWSVSLAVNLSARSLTSTATKTPNAAIGLYILDSNNIGKNIGIQLAQANNTGQSVSSDVPGDFYGALAKFTARPNGDPPADTTTLGASEHISNGASDQILSGGTNDLPTTELIGAVDGVLTLAFNPSTGTITGYCDGSPVGSYSLAIWGPNPPLTLIVAGFSEEGADVPAGTATASGFSIATEAWVGADDFSSGISANWTVYQQNQGQMLAVGTNQHLSFLVGGPATTEQNAEVVWNGTPAVSNDWTMDITGHNSASWSANGASQLQLWLVNSADTAMGYRIAMAGGSGQSNGYQFTTLAQSSGPRQNVPATNADFGLRLVHRGGVAGDIEAWYDPTGNGVAWTLLDTMSMAAFWPGAVASNTFTLAIVADTYYGPIGEGQLWADNFRITNSAIVPSAPVALEITTTDAGFGFTNGVFGFDVSGPAGSNVVIQVSGDLKIWIPLQTNVLGNAPLYYSDSQSPTNHQRFYRAMLR